MRTTRVKLMFPGKIRCCSATCKCMLCWRPCLKTDPWQDYEIDRGTTVAIPHKYRMRRSAWLQKMILPKLKNTEKSNLKHREVSKSVLSHFCTSTWAPLMALHM